MSATLQILMKVLPKTINHEQEAKNNRKHATWQPKRNEMKDALVVKFDPLRVNEMKIGNITKLCKKSNVIWLSHISSKIPEAYMVMSRSMPIRYDKDVIWNTYTIMFWAMKLDINFNGCHIFHACIEKSKFSEPLFPDNIFVGKGMCITRKFYLLLTNLDNLFYFILLDSRRTKV